MPGRQTAPAAFRARRRTGLPSGNAAWSAGAHRSEAPVPDLAVQRRIQSGRAECCAVLGFWCGWSCEPVSKKELQSAIEPDVRKARSRGQMIAVRKQRRTKAHEAHLGACAVLRDV